MPCNPRLGALALVLVACPQDPPLVEDPTADDGATTTPGDVTTGPAPTTGSTVAVACDAVVCIDNMAIPCVDGVLGEPVACLVDCLDGLGCRDCEPGAARCGDAGVERCDDAGAWIPGEPCIAAQGFTCDADTLTCTGPCAPDALVDAGHHGCEFYAVPVASLTYGDDVFGVRVHNPGDEPATLTAEKPLWVGSVTEIPPHATALVFLPWHPHLLNTLDVSTRAAAASVHLQSDRPVAVVQLSPLIPGSSTEASLLVPVRVWSTAYRVASAASRDDYPGLYAVVAGADGVTVDLDPPAGVSVRPGDGVAADGTGSIVLDRGDVLQVLAAPQNDLTGTGITADGPIAVIGGHMCAEVPPVVPSCDHIEESMPPVAQLGRRHAVVPPLRADGAGARAQYVRIIASENLTTLDYDPPQDLPAMLVYAGDHIDIDPDAAAFVIDASAPVLVAQYMLGYGWDDLQGAPALTIATPVERFRRDHTLHASPYWSWTDVDVVAPAGAAVTLDGEPLTDWSPIGGSDLAHAHVRLFPLGEPDHELAADVPIGAQVYGTASQPHSTSYWHPAGHSFAPSR